MAAILLAPAFALGQSALDQYIPSPKPQGTGDGTAGGGSTDGTSGTTTGGGEKGSGPAAASPLPTPDVGDGSSSGSVPGADYPLSPLVMLAGALVLLALLVRALMGARTRLRQS